MAEGTGDIKGLSTSGLQGKSYGKPTFLTTQQIEHLMLAAKQNFGANTMRLQVQQQLMVGEKGDKFDGTYAAKVKEVVQYGIDLGLTIVIDCTTEKGPKDSRSINTPDSGTNAFWSHVAPTWNGHPQVIFDIFNEPDGHPKWSVWHTNMQALVNYLRNALHVTNVLWADADNWSASFDACPGLTDPNGNLVYSFHHPPDTRDEAGWNKDFGNWAQMHKVVNGEFAHNISFNWNSPTRVQAYLDYLDHRNIGQTIWHAFGDNYFGDADIQPAGWWGNMIANRWTNNGWTTYCFAPDWHQSYKTSDGTQITWPQNYQGWSRARANASYLASAVGYGDFTNVMAESDRYRIHLAFKCVHANDRGGVKVLVGVHTADTKPSTWSGVSAKSHVVESAPDKDGKFCTDGKFYHIDIPSEYHAGFADGTYKGVVFGPGATKDVVYQGHFDSDPELIIEVHNGDVG